MMKSEDQESTSHDITLEELARMVNDGLEDTNKRIDELQEAFTVRLKTLENRLDRDIPSHDRRLDQLVDEIRLIKSALATRRHTKTTPK